MAEILFGGLTENDIKAARKSCPIYGRFSKDGYGSCNAQCIWRTDNHPTCPYIKDGSEPAKERLYELVPKETLESDEEGKKTGVWPSVFEEKVRQASGES